ncbi:hypothetical protein F4553_007393 [Allocatelliglobosispora scoriae]|uniref:DUF3149 domain-containing protein n=1 Tax=Allocatelliglobosispora scoriae TaxID=643052 RepID=A0A841C3S0_9ACTN|nr:hypothetical protein [Allocatelliglobosispora scoriae]MBB5873959.1 hypothetical protein [Allocatelliglobosispora scoriae]
MLENLSGWELLAGFAVLIVLVFAALYGVFYLAMRAALRRDKAGRDATGRDRGTGRAERRR